MYIKSKLCVANATWRLVYNSFLGFLNNELTKAYESSKDFYAICINGDIENYYLAFDNYCNQNNINQYQKDWMQKSLFSGAANRLYKPKKTNFAKFTNRTRFVDTGVFKVSFDKDSRVIEFTSNEFSNLDDFIRDNSLLTEYINMVNTIDWPTRTGPNKTLRGCYISCNNSTEVNVFYKVGSNPPLPEGDFNDTTSDEPPELKAEFVKEIKLVSFESHTQPEPQLESEDF